MNHYSPVVYYSAQLKRRLDDQFKATIFILLILSAFYNYISTAHLGAKYK